MTSDDAPESDFIAVLGRWLGGLLALGVLLAPAPDGLQPAAQRLAAVVLLMGVWWVTQALPIAVTSLLPLALFPLLGIQSARDVGRSYLSDSSFLYLSGFIIALGIERWGLHRRLALLTVMGVGISPRRIVLGFLLATFGLSMWISNTATTLLMLPIATALLATLEGIARPNPDVPSGQLPADPAFRHFAIALTLGIAYASSLGGLATVVGTPTNIAYMNIWSRQFPDQPPISAGQWMLTWVPFGLTMLVVTWVVLVWGLGRPRGFEAVDRSFFEKRYLELGSMHRGEFLMLVLFVLTALLWIFRTDFKVTDTPLVPGWSRITAAWLVEHGVPEKDADEFLSDATVGMAIAILMFLIPVQRDGKGKMRFLMDWETASRLPWEILLLFGGGFAIAGAFEVTGLSLWVGRVFSTMAEGQSVWVLVGLVCLLLTFLTEFTSNVATVNAVLPILAATSVALNLDPRLLMIPATISASCAFMLPIGTPPNAIVFGSGRIRTGQMASYGILLNLIGVCLVTVFALWLMIPQLGIRTP